MVAANILAASNFWRIISIWVYQLVSIIPKFIYLGTTFVLQVTDILQIVFRKFAGIDSYSIVTGSGSSASTKVVEGDILNYIIRNILIEKGALNTVFWGIVIIGFCLLFLATLIAILRTQYMAEDAKSASVKKPLNNALKAIVSFIMVPVFCIAGVFISNQILIALDRATTLESVSTLTVADKQKLLKDPNSSTYITYGLGSVTLREDLSINPGSRDESIISSTKSKAVFWSQSTPLSGIIFKAASARANRARNDEGFASVLVGTVGDSTNDANNFSSGLTGVGGTHNTTTTFGIFSISDVSEAEYAARKIDECFANSYMLRDPIRVNLAATEEISDRFCIGIVGGAILKSLDLVTYVPLAQEIKSFSKFNVGLVFYYYDLFAYDWIIGIMPLDNGEALKKWRTEYIKQVIGAYGVIVAMNIFYLLLPLFNSLQFFEVALFEGLIDAVIMIAGLVCVKDMIKVVSDVIGAENLEEAGRKMSKDVVDKAMAIGGVASVFGGVGRKSIGFMARSQKRVLKMVPGVGQAIRWGEHTASKVKKAASGVIKKIADNDFVKKGVATAKKTYGSVKTAAKSVWSGISGEEEWGLKKMSERSDSGGGLRAIFGKYSNAKGVSSSERKGAIAQEKREKERVSEMNARNTRFNSYVDSIKNEPISINGVNYGPRQLQKYIDNPSTLPRSLTLDDVLKARDNWQAKNAAGYGYKEGRSGTLDDGRALWDKASKDT